MNLYHAPSQIFIAGIVFLVFAKTWHSARMNKLGKAFTIFWVLLWSLLLIILFNLNALATIAGALGIGRGVDLVIYLSLIFIFYALFSLAVQIHKMKEVLTKLVRKESLSEVTKKP